MTFTSEFIHESLKIIEKIDQNSIDQVINIISETRDKNGRIFSTLIKAIIKSTKPVKIIIQKKALIR